MTPYYGDDWLTVYHGDSRAVMAEMEPESVHCVVTSPPYWGLRDYGTASWEGGDEGCDHSTPRSRGDDIRAGDKQGTSAGSRPNTTTVCKCGARRVDAQLGLESTPEAYVESMVAVFREVRRVLRSDGTVWLNLGDSYASGEVGRHDGRVEGSEYGARHPGPRQQARLRSGLKPKDLVGIPWRVAFALQADGWYLRSDIIWAKPNPMPESVTDRPTKSHEYLFLLSKSPRYYYDADAVREASNEPWNGAAGFSGSGKHAAGTGYDRAALNQFNGTGTHEDREQSGRNLRSVWTVATQPYPGAHFATFPPKLIEPCIKAGTSERGVCPECGSPRVREMERGEVTGRRDPGGVIGGADAGMYAGRAGSSEFITTGWRPSCRCEHDGGGWVAVPATVLDPFAGSGTTGLVAQRLSRRAVLIDLSMDYLDQLMDRNRDIPMGLVS